ncbi:unnamed protein product, partial [Mesorhabditis belari]|uniref:Uncharacterized protein n=1 Tax=Mesorhabditis belari TaxID=2138241 RepID=A0AAF3FJS3_9BILA
MLVYCLIMSVTSSFIVYCGWALKKSLQEEGKSTKTRNMQKELFKALIFQLLVPLATVYFPVSIFFLAALLGVDGWDTEIITIMVMFDPIIEPIVIIYFIKCYRRPIARLLCCGRRKVCGSWTQETNRYSTGETATKTSRNQIAPDVSQSKEAYSNASLRGNS